MNNKKFKLIKSEQGLSLINPKEPKTKPFIIDFASDKMNYRRKYGGGLGEDLAKAIGVKRDYKPYVIDTTAGMGRDSFMLASLGCEVLMLERNSIIFKLLKDGLKRGSENTEISEIIKRIKVLNIDSIKYLKQFNNDKDFAKPDVIYIDPMFPHSKKSRLVKKEMRIFREIVGDDTDSGELLNIALEKAKKRIVVKRPIKANYLDNLKSNFQILGRINRFDVYLPINNKK